MTQPPYPPPGDADPGADRGWNPTGDDDPTRRLAAPNGEGQRNATRQFGTPEPVPPGQASPAPGYGPPPYGQVQYPPPQYGQAPYGQQPPYGQGQYGGPQYGPAPYDQTPYAGAQHAQPPYGQPPWGPPDGRGATVPPTSNRNTVIALTAGGVLVLAVLVAALFIVVRAVDNGTGRAGGSLSIPEATVSPDGLGDDAFLDALAQDCFGGDMQACDDLYVAAELDSRYGVYGGTCAGRQDVSDADAVFCTDAFPED